MTEDGAVSEHEASRVRFTHAEIVIPLAALMRLPHSDRQVPAADTYTYRDNPWRGAVVTPYAVCQPVAPDSHYYRFDELKRCYGYP